MDEDSSSKDSSHSQQIKALAALVPDLNKMEESSILSGSIEYIKELQRRVMELEEQSIKNTIHELSSQSSTGHPLHIKAKISDTNVLLQIQFENKKGILSKILAEIEKLNLSVTSSSVMSIGTSTSDLTVVAQMEKEFDIAHEDIVEKLHVSCRRFL